MLLSIQSKSGYGHCINFLKWLSFNSLFTCGHNFPCIKKVPHNITLSAFIFNMFHDKDWFTMTYTKSILICDLFIHFISFQSPSAFPINRIVIFMYGWILGIVWLWAIMLSILLTLWKRWLIFIALVQAQLCFKS